MATLAELSAYKAALEQARFSGNRKVKTGNTEIEFKSDSEMASALAEIERQIASVSDARRSAFIRFNTSKGY